MREQPPPPDLDVWLEALAGRRPSNADAAGAAGAAEATMLREALRRWPVSEPAADVAADRVRLTALLAAARADDRLALRRGCPACQALAKWLSWRRPVGAAALVAAALTLTVLAPWLASVNTPAVPEASGALRGAGAEGVQRLRAANPRGLRDRIVDELAKVGVGATRYERLGRYGFDVELPDVRSPELVEILGRHGIAAPQSGGLAVEIEAGP